MTGDAISFHSNPPFGFSICINQKADIANTTTSPMYRINNPAVIGFASIFSVVAIKQINDVNRVNIKIVFFKGCPPFLILQSSS